MGVRYQIATGLSMKKEEITSKNLQRLAAEAGIELKALKKLYIGESGEKSPKTVEHHWYGRRAIAWRAMEKYINIFKMFDLEITPADFLKE